MKRQKHFPGVIMLSFHGQVSTWCALHAEMFIRVAAHQKSNWHLPVERMDGCKEELCLISCPLREWKDLFWVRKSLLWCSWKRNTPANSTPSQHVTKNTKEAQRESAQLTVLQCKILPAPRLLVKQQHPDARINVATNNCNVSDCERRHALPDALLRRNGMLM